MLWALLFRATALKLHHTGPINCFKTAPLEKKVPMAYKRFTEQYVTLYVALGEVPGGEVSDAMQAGHDKALEVHSAAYRLVNDELRHMPGFIAHEEYKGVMLEIQAFELAGDDAEIKEYDGVLGFPLTVYSGRDIATATLVELRKFYEQALRRAAETCGVPNLTIRFVGAVVQNQYMVAEEAPVNFSAPTAGAALSAVHGKAD